jgi:hypothetical protein
VFGIYDFSQQMETKYNKNYSKVMKSRLQAPELIQANQFTFCICKDIRKADDK